MSEFFAWAATGLVVGLQTWSESDGAEDKVYKNGRSTGQAHSASLVDRQRFFLRQRDGREIEIYLVDSGIAFRNGHAVTAVWAARQDATYGHCIYLENHTSGAIARLPENVAAIRSKVRSWKVAGLGFLAAFPAALTLLAWLIYQRGPSYVHQKAFFVSASIALVLLLIIGAVVAKLIADYMRADDDQKIWLAADKALANARRVLLQKPVTKSYHDYGNAY
jgi:hypothetical protein